MKGRSAKIQPDGIGRRGGDTVLLLKKIVIAMKRSIHMDFKIFVSMIGFGVGVLLGDMSGPLWVLIAFMVLDYVTGMTLAFIQKKISSEVGFHGLLKKIGILILVAIGHMLDVYVLNGGSAFREMVIFFFLANEGISILENLGGIGVPIPNSIRNALEGLDSEKEA